MEIRILTEADAELFWPLRLRGLEQEPRAFGSDAGEFRATTPQSIEPRLRAQPDGDFTLGAFLDGHLVGVAGFVREQRIKNRHKGFVWGVYVAEEARGRGVGRVLMEALLERARASSGLEQVTLVVAVGQQAARALYLSLGFEVWGYERAALKVDGEYVDEEYMVLWLRQR